MISARRQALLLLSLMVSAACAGCSQISWPETPGTWTIKIVPVRAWNHERSCELAFAEIEGGPEIRVSVHLKQPVRHAVLALACGEGILYSEDLGRGQHRVHGTSTWRMELKIGDAGVEGADYPPGTLPFVPVIRVDWIKRTE